MLYFFILLRMHKLFCKKLFKKKRKKVKPRPSSFTIELLGTMNYLNPYNRNSRTQSGAPCFIKHQRSNLIFRIRAALVRSGFEMQFE